MGDVTLAGVTHDTPTAPYWGPHPFPAWLDALCRADRYDRQRTLWQNLTRQWREETARSLARCKEQIERNMLASSQLRDEILRVVHGADDPRRLAVADIGVLRLQWADAADPWAVGARDAVVRRWRCTVAPDHGTWTAPPKDRSRSDRPSMCPKCSGAAPAEGQQLAYERSLAALPALAAEIHPTSGFPEGISYGSKAPIRWWHQVPAVRPETGEWYLATHTWQQSPKSRTGTRVMNGKTVGINGCRVCNSDEADDTNSLAAWYPEIAEQWLLAPDGRTPDNTPVGSKIVVWWRCTADRTHDTWPAPPNRRTTKALRSGCNQCSKNVSAKATALFHELRRFLPELELEAPIPLPPEPGRRFRGARVDMWEEPLKLVIEFDGWKAHGPHGWRDRADDDAAKTDRLTRAGQTVIRVRGDLDPIGQHDVVVGSGWSAWKTAVAVLLRIRQLELHALPDLDAYLARGTEGAAIDTERALLGKLYQPRRLPKPPSTPALPRVLTATAPHPDSQLTPVGAPYRDPEGRGQTRRDYECRCGTPATGIVQADVTRGNTKSCGCLAATTRRTPSARPPREDTRAAREWARAAGLSLNANGALPARVLASFLMYRSGHGNQLPASGLLAEADVRQWAEAAGMMLAARGRLTSQTWLAYAETVVRVGGRP